MTTLYEEALSAAEEIREAAEEKAKKKLIESMTPQIKKLVEDNLFEKKEVLKDNESDQDTNEHYLEQDQNECGGMYEDTSKEEEEKNKEEEQNNSSNKEVNESVDISPDSKEILKKLITKDARSSIVSNKLKELNETKRALYQLILLEKNNLVTKSKSKEINTLYKKLLAETKNIGADSIFKQDKRLLNEYLEISKEIENMSRRRKNYLNEDIEALLEMDLFEADGDEDLLTDDPETEPMDDMGGEDSSEDLESLLSDELGDDRDSSEGLEKIRGAAEEILSTVGDLMDQEPMDDEEDSMGDEEDMMDDEEPMEMMDDEEDPMGEGAMDEDDQIIEIDENVLRSEIARMRNTRLFNENNSTSKRSAERKTSNKTNRDVKSIVESRDNAINEAAKAMRNNRILESKISEQKETIESYKKQLNEMNLFNAKLLYANKLMQNKNLSNKQQKNIVESLDNAKTINEAKLLFESLSSSLTKTSNNSINESKSRKVLSSSSKAMSSGQPSRQSNVALDRWATLAGINR